MGDFLTYKVTMLEGNNKLIEDKGLLKSLLIYFLFSLCVVFILYSFYFLKKIVLCASVIVGESLIGQRCIWVVDGTNSNSRLEKNLCIFIFFTTFLWWNEHEKLWWSLKMDGLLVGFVFSTLLSYSLHLLFLSYSLNGLPLKCFFFQWGILICQSPKNK